MSNARTLSAAEYTPALSRLIAAGYTIETVQANEHTCSIDISGPFGRFIWNCDAPSGFGSQHSLEAAADGLSDNLLPTPSPYVLDYFARTNDNA